MASLSLNVLGTGDGQVDPSILIYWNQHRILINCGEGIRRLALEHKFNLAGKLKNILFTRVDKWERIGGLSDILMTAIDETDTQIHDRTPASLHGPFPLNHFFFSTQTFLFKPDLILRIFEYQRNHQYNTFEVDGLKIQPILINKSNQEDSIEGVYPFPKTIAVNYWKYRNTEQEKLSDPIIASYIFTTPQLPGKFDVKKSLTLKRAAALGVPKGPLCGKLVKGETITLSDGRQVSPNDCVSEPSPGPVFIVIECPSLNVCNALKSHPLLKPYFGCPKDQLLAVVHITPRKVLQSPEYKELLSSFSNTTKHIIVNEDNQNNERVFLHLPIACSFEDRLHRFFPELYPKLYCVSRSEAESSLKEKKKDDYLFKMIGDIKGVQLTHASPLMTFTLLPISAFGFGMHKSEKEGHWHEKSKDDSMLASINSCRKHLLSQESQELKLSSEVLQSATSIQTDACFKASRVSFLGTIAAQVSKIRNVSSILLEYPQESGRVSAIMLDSGEANFAQLVRLRGIKQAENLLLNELKVIFISHKHVDHMLGVTGLLSRLAKLRRKRSGKRTQPKFERTMYNCKICGTKFSSEIGVKLHFDAIHHEGDPSELPHPEISEEEPIIESIATFLESDIEEPPLVVVGPFWVELWLNEFSTISDLPFVFVDCEYLTVENHKLNNWFKKTLGASVQTLRVFHSFPSYAIIMKHEALNKKIVYSGDTRPCDALVRVGMNADLLIHEGTFSDDMISKAKKDRHSIISEAIDISAKMEAKATVLTHFSGRFETEHPPVYEYSHVNTAVVDAFDFLTIQVDDNLPNVCKLYNQMQSFINRKHP